MRRLVGRRKVLVSCSNDGRFEERTLSNDEAARTQTELMQVCVRNIFPEDACQNPRIWGQGKTVTGIGTRAGHTSHLATPLLPARPRSA